MATIKDSLGPNDRLVINAKEIADFVEEKGVVHVISVSYLDSNGSESPVVATSDPDRVKVLLGYLDQIAGKAVRAQILQFNVYTMTNTGVH